MTVKKFMKKLNRGLALALVLVIGLAIYIAVDETRFKKEKPQIVQTLNAYMADLGKVMNTPEEYQKLGEKMPEEALKQQEKELEEVLNRYWISTGSRGENYYYSETYLQEWLQIVNALLEQTSYGNGYLSSWNCRIEGSPQIYKNGSDSATVQLDYTLIAEYTGKVNVPGPDSYASLSVELETDGSSQQEQENQAMRLTVTGSLGFELERSDNTWRIKSTTGNGYNYSEPVPVNEEA